MLVYYYNSFVAWFQFFCMVLFPFSVPETWLFAIKFERRIYRPDTYLAIMKMTFFHISSIGILEKKSNLALKKYQYYSQIGQSIFIQSENIKPDQTVTPPKN